MNFKAFRFRPPQTHRPEVVSQQNQLSQNNQNVIRPDAGRSAILRISNKENIYRLVFGRDFRDLLDARDRVLEHQFDWSFNLNLVELDRPNYKFLESDLYENIKVKFRLFLAEAVSNVISVGFNFLCRDDLDGKEAKQYISKNMMQNIHSLSRHTISALQNCSQLGDKINFKQLKYQLVIELDNILQNIFINLIDYYPQATGIGGSLRMKDVIVEINRIEDEENDFIFNADIKIAKYLKIYKDVKGFEAINFEQDQQEYYTRYIMEVLNAVIEANQDNSKDWGQRTNFQKFSQFNHKLFWTVQQKNYQNMLKNHDRNKNIELSEEQQVIQKHICDYFDTILNNDKEKTQEFSNQLSTRQIINKTSRNKDQSENGVNDFRIDLGRNQADIAIDLINNLWSNADEGAEQIKRHNSFKIGSKIPNSVKIFNRHEISNKQFYAKHSSILRILTKWASYLEQPFQNPQKFVTGRLYPFKNIHNQICNLFDGQNGKEKLIKQLKQEHQIAKSKFKVILQNSYEFMSEFLSQGSVSSSILRYASTRETSSKIKSVLTSLMLTYTNILIHHLLRAGHQIWTDKFYQNLNLINFKVSDLMRSKIECTESSCISLFRTLYLLNDSEVMKGKFKLIRIKNKLDESTNNIMVNYLFMGKIQCELQIFLQEAKNKEKNYQALNHGIYELIRGKFGPISQIAIMISQLDPIISASDGTFYQEKYTKINFTQHEKPYKSRIIPGIIREGIDSMIKEEESSKIKEQQKNKQREKQILQSEKLNQKIRKYIFECQKCKLLVKNQNADLFKSKQYKKICYDCVLKDKYPQKMLSQQCGYKKILNEIAFRGISTIQQLKSIKSQQYVIELTKSGQLYMHAAVYNVRDFKTYLLKIDPKVLAKIDMINLDFSSIEYFDMLKLIKKSRRGEKLLSGLIYVFDNIEDIPQNILQILQLHEGLKIQAIKKMLTRFKIFRLEKNLIKKIKQKAEILKPLKEEIDGLQRIIKTLVLQKDENQNLHRLQYRKYNHLDMFYLKQLKINYDELTQIPSFIRQCKSLKYLDLDNNHISDVNHQSFPPFLHVISLAHNKFTSFDLSVIGNTPILNIQNNDLRYINNNNSTLVELDLQNNKIEQFQLENHGGIVRLNLRSNMLKKVRVNDCPKLFWLNLTNNQLSSIEVSRNDKLAWLYLRNNKLQKLDMGSNGSLVGLTLRDNPNLVSIKNLPVSLNELWIDHWAAVNYDFNSHSHLREVRIFNKHTERYELKNLPGHVDYLSVDQ